MTKIKQYFQKLKETNLKDVNIKELFKNDTFLKVISFIIAVSIFITVTGVGSPFWKDVFTTTDYIDSVPLSVEYDDDLVVSGIPTSVAVNVSGSENYVTATMKQKQNLVGKINFQYSTPGEYDFDTSLIEFNNTLPVTITPVNTSFPIVIQEKVSASKPIDLGYINGDGSTNGFMLEDPISNIESTVATGGSDDVERVVSVRGFIDLSALKTVSDAGTHDFEVNLVPYDADGKVVANVELNPPSVKVTQEYTTSTVQVPVNYSVINNNTGLYISSICESDLQGTCSDSYVPTVLVYGDSDKVNSLKSITYQLNLQEVISGEATIEGSAVLPVGVYVLGDQVKSFDIKLEKGTTRTIEDVPITVANLDSNLQAKEVDSSYSSIDVEVTGALSVVNNLESSDITLLIDLGNFNKPGTYKVPIVVNSSKYFDTKLPVTELDINIEEVNNE